MVRFVGEGREATAPWDNTGVLLVNLGSPEAPTAAALKPYLKEFLWDPRVVEVARPIWWLVLNGIILRTRPAKSAEAYQEVWGDDGAPLLAISRRQQEKITAQLKQRHGDKLVVELAMRYGEPSIKNGLRALKRAGAIRILVVPLYPQYSASTSASVCDAVFSELQQWRRMPELRTITQYYQQTGYIKALANSVREHWQQHGQANKLLMSFHGIPQRYADNGDPYRRHCEETAAALAAELQLDDEQWQLSFQSRFGKEEWLKPYTDETLKAWGKQGLDSVQVICPGFSADCLETLEEIDGENREYFEESGGGQYSYIPALNDRDDHIVALCDLIETNLQGWI